MKKILFVMHALGYGGAERSLVNLLCELPADQYQADVLLLQRRGDFIRQLPDWVHIIDAPEAARHLYSPVKRAGKYLPAKVCGTLLSRAVRKNRKARYAWRWRHVYSRLIAPVPGHYDVAVAYTGAEILYFVADKVAADKKLVWIHNDYLTAGYSAEDDRPYLEKMDEIVSVSEGCVKTLKEVFPHLRDKMHYLENITSSALVRQRAQAFVPAEYRKGCNILSVGRLWEQKGFDIAIDAAAIMKAKGLDFCWFIVGEGDLRAELQQKIDQCGLQAQFILLGTRENPYPYMQHCDVLVQPSRWEGKSVVLDEAKMLCKPIVATAYPTVADQVKDGCEGMIVPLDAQGLAEGIERMLQDEKLRTEIAQYLAAHEYGNQQEVLKYRKLLDA